jgi:uncharacterized integral membrane protein
MSYLRLALVFLLLLAAVLFGFSNNQPVQLWVWPMPQTLKTPALPLSVVVLAAMALAYFAGVFSRWWQMIGLRRRVKRAESELAATQLQLRGSLQQIAAMQAAPPVYPPPPPPIYPPPPSYPPHDDV